MLVREFYEYMKENSSSEKHNLDSAMRQQIASSLDYVHKSDVNMAALTVPLHGVNLSRNQFIILYDSHRMQAKDT